MQMCTHLLCLVGWPKLVKFLQASSSSSPPPSPPSTSFSSSSVHTVCTSLLLQSCNMMYMSGAFQLHDCIAYLPISCRYMFLTRLLHDVTGWACGDNAVRAVQDAPCHQRLAVPLLLSGQAQRCHVGPAWGCCQQGSRLPQTALLPSTGLL